MSASAKKTAFRLGLGLLLVLGVAVRASFWTGGEISAQRVRIAQSLLREYFQKNGFGASNENAADDSIEDFSRQCGKLSPRASGDALTEQEVLEASEKTLAKMSRDAVPMPSDKELELEAEKAYPLYRPGDRVVVAYMPNPQYPTAIEGIYQGKLGPFIRVGNARIRIQDMMRIENNQAEIVKFDPEATARLRKEYVARRRAELVERRQQYQEENQLAVRAQQRAVYTERNERAGYTFYLGEWLAPKVFLVRVAEAVRAEVTKVQATARHRERMQAIRFIEDQSYSEFLKTYYSPNSDRPNPEDTLLTVEQASNERLEREKKARADEEACKQAALDEARQQAATAANLTAAAEAKRLAAEQAAVQATASPAQGGEEEPLSMMSPKVVLAVFLSVVLLALAGWVIYSRRSKAEQKDTFKKFFEGKGKLQKDFWEQAESDPDHFKYVAYMFPSIAEANQSLQKLSYIQVSGSGDLKCSREILFGVYPHLEGAVAFVGGTKFNYALWREASAVMPEQPGAVYFKVSTEPAVFLDIPDVEKLATESDLHIENLGMEEIAGKDGAFIRCYKYRTDTKDAAMAFLAGIEVKEEGISIQVETSEGVIGKDENGIYTA